MPYKDFANGFPLFASEIDQYLMNQAVMTFANVGERAAALPTPTEGMITYLADDNQLYKWTGADWENVAPASVVTNEGDLIIGDAGGSETRLPIGANGSLLYSDGTTGSWLANSGVEGDVLQVNASGGLEFVTPGGGGGWTLLSTTSLASSTVTDITAIDQGYKNLRVVVDGLLQSSNGFVGIRAYQGNTSTGSSFYSCNINASGSWDQDSGNALYFGQAMVMDSAAPVSFVSDILNYTDNTVQKPTFYYGACEVSGNPRSFVGFGKLTNLYYYDIIRVYHTGTATAGTVKIYGGS